MEDDPSLRQDLRTHGEQRDPQTHGERQTGDRGWREMPMDLAHALRRARRARSWSYRTAGRQLGVSFGYLACLRQADGPSTG